jgi:hypothetical protein
MARGDSGLDLIRTRTAAAKGAFEKGGALFYDAL